MTLVYTVKFDLIARPNNVNSHKICYYFLETHNIISIDFTSGQIIKSLICFENFVIGKDDFCNDFSYSI